MFKNIYKNFNYINIFIEYYLYIYINLFLYVFEIDKRLTSRTPKRFSLFHFSLRLSLVPLSPSSTASLLISRARENCLLDQQLRSIVRTCACVTRVKQRSKATRYNWNHKTLGIYRNFLASDHFYSRHRALSRYRTVHFALMTKKKKRIPTSEIVFFFISRSCFYSESHSISPPYKNKRQTRSVTDRRLINLTNLALV